TIGQGDTRASGLTQILAAGGAILRAQRRLKWPGEAAVVVSVVHLLKGTSASAMLDGSPVSRVSAYLVEGELDISPFPLAENAKKAFKGSELQGMGFSIDDALAQAGSSISISEMDRLFEDNPLLAERIKPFLGGFELNNDPSHAHSRYAINISDLSLEAAKVRYPKLVEIIEKYVKPERDRLKGGTDAVRRRENWWKWSRSTPDLYRSIENVDRVVATIFTSPHSCFSIIGTNQYFANSVIVFVLPIWQGFVVLQSRCHEVWIRYFSSTMKDDLRYAPSDCFRTFPFPGGFESSAELEAAGQAYHDYRAELMVAREEGLTKTYNRFHDRGQNASDIVRLRELHAEMDDAVLRAYGWDDLADRAAPEFIEQDADEGKTPKTRLDWPAEFKDEVLARLLALNAARAAEERAAGLVAADEGEDEEIEEGDGE
ncbi:MAG: hypothetical protein HQ465_01015, partial [Rhodospirillales bacterium]|nr:hypothetical protein [Rhodospirillales bacterium]